MRQTENKPCAAGAIQRGTYSYLSLACCLELGLERDIRGLMRLIQVHKLLFEATDGIILGASTATITQWSDVYAAL